MAEPAWGEVAILPWDSRIFGFPVAQYRPGKLSAVLEDRASVFQSLLAWSREHNVQLMSCTVPGNQFQWLALLNTLGFRFVDYNVRVRLRDLQNAKLPEARMTVRPAEPPDQSAVEHLAGTSFGFSRYHADALFPSELSDLRFRKWMTHAFGIAGLETLIYVMGEPGNVIGFYHVELKAGIADLRLAAVDRSLQRTMVGFELYCAVLHRLRTAGAREVISKISVANMGVMRVYLRLGFELAEPEPVFHWHVPGSSRLLDLEDL
jgi:GNAT superfamily N-acetyltransferase